MITITIPKWLLVIIVILLVLDFANKVLEIIQWKLDRDIKVNKRLSEDAISREWAINKQKELIELYTPHKTVEGRGQVYWQIEERKLVAKELEQAPSVIPQAKEGEWIRQGISPHEGIQICSVCGAMYDITAEFDNCPNCHAKMKGADDD